MRFWTVRSDGDDSRLEFGDSIFTGTFGFSWSPDGKSVAWLRQVQKDAPSIVEIIIRDLTTGNERQLTYDGKYINDVCWARNNEIIYSSNKGGIPDLWGVPAAGGQASQITSASGASGIAISANCRLLVYNQQQTIGHVWIVPVDGSPAQQVTFDDSDIRWPSLSPDGKQIAYMTYGVISRVFMMDRDGTNRRKLSSEAWDSYVPRWSPDGKWISFCSSPPSANDESSQVVLVDPRNPLTPRSIGQGDDAYWVSDTILSITRGTKSWLTPTTGKDPRQFFIDSTWAMPVINGTYIMYCDFRAGREGWWVLPSEHQNDPSGKWDRKITPAGELPMVSQQQLFVFSFIHGGFWKLLLPDGRRERLRVIQSSVDEFKTGGIGNRGKEIVYADSRRSSKLVMIENLFK
jgi:Tol biopolymer transport system component